MTEVLTIGTFDLLHIGHLELLKYCRALTSENGRVSVGLNTEEFCNSYGKFPVQSWEDRCENLKTYARVWGTNIHENHSWGKELILKVKPSYLVVGNDWLDRDYMKQIGMTTALLSKHHVTVCFAPRTTGVSTSAIRGIK